MGVITDKLLSEVEKELDALKASWTPPDVHQGTLKQLEEANQALQRLQVC
jgi:hypothetical protein